MNKVWNARAVCALTSLIDIKIITKFAFAIVLRILV